jgi:hypothetical protein
MYIQSPRLVEFFCSLVFFDLHPPEARTGEARHSASGNARTALQGTPANRLRSPTEPGRQRWQVYSVFRARRQATLTFHQTGCRTSPMCGCCSSSTAIAVSTFGSKLLLRGSKTPKYWPPLSPFLSLSLFFYGVYPLVIAVKVGVFASRSPHRPNPIGLTAAKLEKVCGSTLLLSGTHNPSSSTGTVYILSCRLLTALLCHHTSDSSW